MAVEASQPLKISIPAGADLSSSQYLAVKRDGSGNAVVVAAATDNAIGILQNKPKAAGQMAEVVVVGVTKWVSGGAITIGDPVAFTSAGKAQTCTLQGYGAGYVQGTKKAVGQLYGQASASNNDVATVEVNFLNPSPAT